MRLVQQLSTIEPKDLVDEENNQIWIPASKKARLLKVTVATIYDRIRNGKLEARNFEGRVFVKNQE
jgi:hypothetical protein